VRLYADAPERRGDLAAERYDALVRAALDDVGLRHRGRASA